MTIKQQGGIFGRNPTFNDLEVDGSLTIGGSAIPAPADIAKLNVAQTFTAAQTFNNDVILGSGSALQINDQDSILFGTFSNGSSGTLLQGGSSTSYLMYVGGSLRASIDTSGNLDMTATNSGNIKLKSGNGIDFSATSGTGTSELFDDYEEGTWTPTNDSMTVNSGTFAATGTYVKIGKLVFIDVIQTSGTVSASSGVGMISGFPFAPARSSTVSYSNSAGTLAGVGLTETNSKFYGATAFSSQTALRFASVYTT